jgi:flagellar basal body-associated protein FliL
MKKFLKPKILAPVLVLVLGGGMAYKMFLAPKPAVAKKKIEGHLVTLDPEFVVNLADGRYGKLTVSLLLEGAAPAAAAGGGHGAGGLEQEAVVRSVVTDTVTGVHADALIDRRERAHLVEHVLKKLHKTTDEHEKKVYFTDIAVQ